MAEHDRFRFHSVEEIQQKLDELGLELPVSDDFSILATPVKYGKKEVPNRLGCHPMEGCDGEPQRRSIGTHLQAIPPFRSGRGRD